MVSSREILNLAEQLKYIPHLPLDLEVDLEGLLSELPEALKYIVPWQADVESQFADDVIKVFSDSWSLCGVFDYFTDPREGARAIRKGHEQMPHEKWPNGLDRTRLTELGARTPRTVAQVMAMGDFPGRTRFSLIKPNGSLIWHSHYKINQIEDEHCSQFKGSTTHYNTPEYVHPIVHIPIVTNDKVEFVVRSHHDCPGYMRKYKLGEAVIFNSWHEHNVFNHDSNADRYHLMCHMHLADEKFFHLVARSVKKYQGAIMQNLPKKLAQP